MFSRAPAKQEKSARKLPQKMRGHTSRVQCIIRLPNKRRIITCSHGGEIQVWDLRSGKQVGDAWQDYGSGWMLTIALSPDGKRVAIGTSFDAVRLWDIDTRKVKEWTGHTHAVNSIYWSPDGRRVVSGSDDGTFRVWDVKSGKTVIGPIEAGDMVRAVCYSPDGTMIATGAWYLLKIWDANTGELLKTLEVFASCLVWTSDGKTLITAGSDRIMKFDTATWANPAVLRGYICDVNGLSLSPNQRVLASTSWNKSTQLWNLETNLPIGPSINSHGGTVKCATFSADGKFLVTGCRNDIYKWDVSAIIKDAGLDDLPSDNVNTGNKRFIDVHYVLHTLLSRLPSFLRRHSNSRGETERDTQSQSHPRSWAKHIVSSALRRQYRADIQLREPQLVDTCCKI